MPPPKPQNLCNLRLAPERLWAHLRTPALKTAIFSKKSVVVVKRENGFAKTFPGLIFPGFSVQGTVLVNPFSCFTKTTDFLTKIRSLKGRGSWMTSDVRVVPLDNVWRCWMPGHSLQPIFCDWCQGSAILWKLWTSWVWRISMSRCFSREFCVGCTQSHPWQSQSYRIFHVQACVHQGVGLL